MRKKNNTAMIFHRQFACVRVMLCAASTLQWLSSIGVAQAAMTADPKGPVEYRQTVRVCDFQAAKEDEQIIVPSGLHGWEFKIQNQTAEKLWVGVCIADAYKSAAPSFADVEWSVQERETAQRNYEVDIFPAKDDSSYCWGYSKKKVHRAVYGLLRCAAIQELPRLRTADGGFHAARS